MALFSGIIDKIKFIKNSALLRKKTFITFIFFMLIINYLLICYHIERNPFSFFPSWPVTDSREKVTLYFPSLDTNSLLKEHRLIAKNDNKTSFIREIVKSIIQGSNYENTRAAVPIKGMIRKIWIYKKTCVIDLYFESLKPDTQIVKGSEKNFKEAINKTIKENLPEIEKIYILSKGIVNKEIWEVVKN